MIARPLVRSLVKPLARGSVLTSGGDLPSLDLAFALDRSFTTDPAAAGGALITSRRGPAAKFMRATGATEVGPDKLIRYAPENQMAQSGGALASNMTSFTAVSTSLLDPDGDTVNQLTTLAVAGQARLETSGLTVPIYTTYFSVWVRAKEGFSLPAYFHLVLGDGNKAQFNTANWSITNDTGGVGSVEFGPDGWVKLKLVITTFSSSNFKVVVTDAPTYGAAVAAGKVFFIGGRNISRQSFTHYKTTGSPFYGPRFDHDPITGECKGLLIEEERRNFLARSEEFETTWVPSNTTVLPNQTVSPNGQTTADKLVEVASLSQHFISQQTTKAASSITYAFSVYYKNASGTRNLILAITNGTSAGRGAIFTTSGSVAAANISVGSGIGFTIISAVVENAGGGWYRASITVSSDTSTRLDGVIYLSNSSSSITVYDGDGTSGIFLWGAQLEAGAFPTSYIPTAATVPLTRSADVCSIIGTDFSSFYNQSEGTVVVVASEFRRGTAYVPIVRFAISSNSGANRFQIGTNGSKTGDSSPLEFFCTKASVLQYQSFGVSPTPESRAGLAYKTGDIRGVLNGTLGAADSPPSELLEGADLMNIGSIGMHIARIQYFRKRLPNAKLQTLTAP